MTNPRDVNLDIVGHDHTGRATRSAAHNIDSLERKLGGIGKVAGRAAKDTDKSMQSVAASIRSVGPIGILAIATAAAAAAPMVAGVISGAITAGGVLGVAGLAAYLQRDNPQIKAAADRLSKTVSKGLKKASEPLVGEFVTALDKITAATNRNMPLVNRAFKAVGPSIVVLTDGLIGFVEKAAPGFVKMLEKSQPVIDAIADALPGLGASLGSVFEIIGDNAPQAAIAIGDLIRIIGVVLVMIAGQIAALSRLYAANRSTFLGIVSIIVSAMRTVNRVFTSAISGLLRQAGTFISKIPGMGAVGQAMIRAAGDVERGGARIEAKLAKVQRSIDGLRGKNVDLWVNVKVRGLGGLNKVKQIARDIPAGSFSGGPSFAFAGPTGMGRTEAPRDPVVNVDSRVYLDGRVIASVARSTVNDSASRQAWRARVGRR